MSGQKIIHWFWYIGKQEGLSYKTCSKEVYGYDVKSKMSSLILKVCSTYGARNSFNITIVSYNMAMWNHLGTNLLLFRMLWTLWMYLSTGIRFMVQSILGNYSPCRQYIICNWIRNNCNNSNRILFLIMVTWTYFCLCRFHSISTYSNRNTTCIISGTPYILLHILVDNHLCWKLTNNQLIIENYN